MIVHLSAVQWALTLLVISVGGFVTGTGGFGFALVTTPFLLWVLPPPMIVVTNLSLSVAMRVPLVWSERHHVIRREALLLGIGGLIGLPLGVLLLTTLHRQALTIGAEALIIVLSGAYVVGADRLPRLRDRSGLGRVLIGVSSGTLNTSISLSGPPMVLWLLNQQLSGRAFRATVSATGLVLNIVGVTLLIRSGGAQLSWLLIAAVGLPAAALGLWGGTAVLDRMPHRAFVRGVAIFVILSSLTGLVLAF